MAWYLVTYDVKTPYQSQVKKNLMASGFTDKTLLVTKEVVQLPSTTLLVDAANAKEAAAKFKAVAAAGVLPRSTGPVVERYVVVALTRDSHAEG
ncbi:hypothetical protein HUA78_30465 [Myxococcus sp. CA033]|uniref:hypothetical protein n=1 Tax=Myxococcus sp. CA033 TaxID=2741516 RepID=UPI00157A96AE|nr:hypothetical protein [Myxococcus sp. CA033]NTX38777.1 hypothetical protein [Myxococcus sp. CA033]